MNRASIMLPLSFLLMKRHSSKKSAKQLVEHSNKNIAPLDKNCSLTTNSGITFLCFRSTCLCTETQISVFHPVPQLQVGGCCRGVGGDLILLSSVEQWGYLPVGCVILSVSNLIPNSFKRECKLRPSLYVHAFHHRDYDDSDVHISGEWLLATETHQACTILPIWMQLQIC